MASEQATYQMTPVGRVVFIDVKSKDDKGAPLTMSDGQPYSKRTVGIAIPKGTEADWKQTPWGQAIAGRAAADWKGGQPGWPSFSWKVEDGDSAVPNKKGNKNCDREGWPGHWVIKPSSNFAIKVVDANGGPTSLGFDDFYPGCFAQAYISTKGNANNDSPGMYLNLEILAFTAHGERIEGTGSIDATTVGFGGAAPAGASPTPPGQAVQPAAGQTPPPPRQEFSAGAAGAPPPPPVADRVTDKARAAGATTMEQLLAWNGWTEALLVQHGYLTP